MQFTALAVLVTIRQRKFDMTSSVFGPIELEGILSLEFAFHEGNQFAADERIGRNMTSLILVSHLLFGEV